MVTFYAFSTHESILWEYLVLELEAEPNSINPSEFAISSSPTPHPNPSPRGEGLEFCSPLLLGEELGVRESRPSHHSGSAKRIGQILGYRW
jgi:hypothetical protein